MATTIHNGYRNVTILNARERVTGHRGSWTVNTNNGNFRTPAIVGISSKRTALTTAANIARAQRATARRIAAAKARMDAMTDADRAELLAEVTRTSTPAHEILARRDAAAERAAEDASWKRATDWAAAERAGDDAVDTAQRAACAREAGAYVRLTMPIEDAHAAALVEDQNREAARYAAQPAAEAEQLDADGDPILRDVDGQPLIRPATQPAEDGHRAVVRPASSRFIGNDADRGIEAECWECGGRIVRRFADGEYRHAAGDAPDLQPVGRHDPDRVHAVIIGQFPHATRCGDTTGSYTRTARHVTCPDCLTAISAGALQPAVCEHPDVNGVNGPDQQPTGDGVCCDCGVRLVDHFTALDLLDDAETDADRAEVAAMLPAETRRALAALLPQPAPAAEATELLIDGAHRFADTDAGWGAVTALHRLMIEDVHEARQILATRPGVDRVFVRSSDRDASGLLPIDVVPVRPTLDLQTAGTLMAKGYTR
jgi:hypothetical protein